MESTGLRKCRKEKEPSSIVSAKRKESNYNKSKKGKEPQIYLNEDMGTPIETTSKNIKEVPESSLGRNQNASSPAKRTLAAVLERSADHSEEKKKRQKMHKGTNNLKSENWEEKKQANSKTTHKHNEVGAIQQDNQKKRRSIHGDKSVQSKISNTTEDVTRKIDVDASCHVQDQNVRINKSLEAGAITDEEHKEMFVLQPDITRNKRSKRGEKHMMENGWNRLSNTLPNNNLVGNLMEKKVDSVDGKTIADTVCEVNKQEVLPSKSLEGASKMADEQEETCEGLSDCLPLNRVLREIKTKRSAEQRSKRILEREMKKLSNMMIDNHSNPNQENSDQLDGKVSTTSPITASKVNQKGLKKKAVQACKELVGASETTDKEEVGVTHSKKRSKEKRHDGQKYKNILDNGCVSDITITKRLESDSSFPEYTEHSLISNMSSKEALSDDKHAVLQSLRPSNCENDNLTHTPNVCNETKSPGGLKTYRRKDKNFCPLANNSESSISKDQLEDSANCPITLEKKDEINSRNKNELNLSPNVQHPPHNKYPEEDRVGQTLNISPDANIEREHEPVPDQENDSATCSNQLPQEKVSYSSKSVEDCANKRSASKKTPRKDKTRSTSDPSSKCPFSPSHEGTTTSPLNEFQMEAIDPSVEGVSKDAATLGNEIVKDVLQKRSASPEIIHTTQLRRKLLILDLNGLLVDIVSSLPEGYQADTWIARKALIKRPFCDDFLKFCFETFDVGVWSSRTRRNVDTVIDFIMGDLRHQLLFCWDQNHCTDTGFSTVEEYHKPMVLKELRKVWQKFGEYNESNTVLLDDSPYKALINPPHTAIFPCSYEFRQKNDNALGPGGNIRTYLENLAAAPHVQKFIEKTPFGHPFGQRAVTKKNTSWGYYLRVINANAFRLPA